LQPDLAPQACRQHHQAHDGARIHACAVLDDGDFGLEPRRRLHDLGGGAGVKRFIHAGAPRSAEPARIYLRPASIASFTACSSGNFDLMSISLMRLGRLTPAITSILLRSSKVSARLQGVPPNISVAITTPAPMSTDLAAAAISR